MSSWVNQYLVLVVLLHFFTTFFVALAVLCTKPRNMNTMTSSSTVLLALLAIVPWSARSLTPPPRFVMNLDSPASTRWNGAVKAVLDVHPFEWSFGAAFSAHNTSMYNNVTEAQYQLIGNSFASHYPQNADELRGISAQFADLGHYVSFEYLAAWVYFHELAHTDIATPDSVARNGRSCCAVLARDATTKEIMHVGNMDQSPLAVRNVTLQVEFRMNGSVVFEGVDWYWFTTGVTRAVREGMVSVQENWRTDGLLDSGTVLSQIQEGVVPQVLVFRNLLTSVDPFRDAAANFSQIVDHLSSVPLAAPFYIIVAGSGGDGDGVVIARSNDGVAGPILRLSDAEASGSFFIAQTNYDHWQPDSADDPRRTVSATQGSQRMLDKHGVNFKRAFFTQALEQYLNAMGSSVGTTELGLFGAVSTFPAHNPDTAYTAVLRPDTGSLTAFVRTVRSSCKRQCVLLHPSVCDENCDMLDEQAMCPQDPDDPSVVTDSLYCRP